jgi:hypothetical protein
MNDFTKEELEMIRHAVDIYHSVLADPLRIKLQAMIDNYCEHANKLYYERVMLYECTACHMVTL